MRGRHRARGPEEPRVRRHRRDTPAERPVRRGQPGAIIYALFCTSRQISTGPSSALAAVAGGAVLLAGLGGEEAAQLVAAITLVTGALFLLLAVFRMGWIAQFLSKAVVTGFLAGAAVNVVIGELPKLTGTSSEGESAWRELASWIGSLGTSTGPRWSSAPPRSPRSSDSGSRRPRYPGRWCWWPEACSHRAFDLGAHGVALVGDVPRGLPAPQLPDLELVSRHLSEIGIASVALLLIGFSQTAGDARAFATRHRYRNDVNQESVAQGMANVGAGVFQGMPVSTSLSASSLNETAGARTPMASLTTGGLVVATLIVLAPLFSDLPKAVLAAIIIDAVVFGMFDLAELARLHRVTRFDFWIAVAAILGVLFAGVLAGVVIGVALSLGWLIYVATRPPMPLLGRQTGTQVSVTSTSTRRARTYPGIVVLGLDGGLFFATAEALEDRIRALADADEPLRVLVLDFEGVNFIDSQGAAKTAEILKLTDSRGIALRLAGVRPCWRCSAPTRSSTGSGSITSTATFTAPSMPRSATSLPLPRRAEGPEQR